MMNNLEQIIEENKNLNTLLEEESLRIQRSIINLKREGMGNEKIAELLVLPIEKVECIHTAKNQMDMDVQDALKEHVQKLREDGCPEYYIENFSKGFQCGFKAQSEILAKRMLQIDDLELETIAYFTSAPLAEVVRWRNEIKNGE